MAWKRVVGSINLHADRICHAGGRGFGFNYRPVPLRSTLEHDSSAQRRDVGHACHVEEDILGQKRWRGRQESLPDAILDKGGVLA